MPTLQEFGDRMLRPAMRAWARSVEEWALDPAAAGESPHVHSQGAVGHRVLLIGSGIAVGWGVQTTGLALPGAIARALTSLTGMGADVDVIAAPRMSPMDVVQTLAELSLERFDLVVLSLGVPEAMELMTTHTWRREITSVLQVAVDVTPPSTGIALLGVADIRAIPHHDSVFADRAHRRARAFDLISQEVVGAMERVQFVAIDRVPVSRAGPASGVYGSWGTHIASELACVMDSNAVAQRESSPPKSAEECGRRALRAETRRQAAVDSLTPVISDRMTRLVTLTRSAFGTDVALFTIIDGDTQHNRIRVGTDDDTYPRAASFCTQTIHGRGELVVGDAQLDPRFADSPLVVGEPYIRFYAGFPIESPSGERIGALCIIDPEPRRPEDIDERLLRELALALQADIWATTATGDFASGNDIDTVVCDDPGACSDTGAGSDHRDRTDPASSILI